MKAKHLKEHGGMEIGIYTLADINQDPYSGKIISTKQRLKEIIRAAKLADRAGLDVFGVGEHHRPDYAVSSPGVALAAISQVTKQIRLTSATTVLNTIDPVRLFEEFATLDLLSNGRAEIIAGRGAFTESFPLFGYDINLYDELFEEHLHLILELNKNKMITWDGQFRSALNQTEISPRPVQKNIPIWVGVSGTAASAERAGKLGAGLNLVILGGDPLYFKPHVDIYREAACKAGHDPECMKIAVSGHVYISETAKQAKDEFYPYYFNYWKSLNTQHKVRTQLTREDFEQAAAPETALFVGSSQQIIEKILQQYEIFGHQRFLAQTDIGGLPFKKVAENIERLATEIAPVIRRETSK